MTSGRRRIAATIIALAAWAGLAAGYAAVLDRTGSVGKSAWIMSSYFTNTTGLLIAVLFTAIAAGACGPWKPRLLGAAAVCVLLVGIVQRLLLHGLRELRGGDAVADILLHQVVPVLVPLFWLAFARKGLLRYRDPPIWTSYPLAFLVFALVQGLVVGRYSYPFIDIAKIGWWQVAGNAAGIAMGFLASGWALVWLDHRLERALPAADAERPR